MPRRRIEILHKLLTNQFFIIAGAILLFLLVNTLMGPGKVEPVMNKFLA
jgi:hypothetical protein